MNHLTQRGSAYKYIHPSAIPQQEVQVGTALVTGVHSLALATEAVETNCKPGLPLSARCLGLQAKRKGQKSYAHDNPAPAKDKMC